MTGVYQDPMKEQEKKINNMNPFDKTDEQLENDRIIESDFIKNYSDKIKTVLGLNEIDIQSNPDLTEEQEKMSSFYSNLKGKFAVNGGDINLAIENTINQENLEEDDKKLLIGTLIGLLKVGGKEKKENIPNIENEIDEKRQEDKVSYNKNLLVVKGLLPDELYQGIIDTYKNIENYTVSRKDIISSIKESSGLENKSELLGEVNKRFEKFDNKEKNTRNFDKLFSSFFDDEFTEKIGNNSDLEYTFENIKGNLFVNDLENPEEIQNAFEDSLQMEISEIIDGKKNIDPDKINDIRMDMKNNELNPRDRIEKLLKFKIEVTGKQGILNKRAAMMKVVQQQNLNSQESQYNIVQELLKKSREQGIKKIQDANKKQKEIEDLERIEKEKTNNNEADILSEWLDDTNDSGNEYKLN